MFSQNRARTSYREVIKVVNHVDGIKKDINNWIF